MNSSKDIQHNTAVLSALTPVTVTTGGGTFFSASTDTSGFRSLMYAIETSRAIVDGADSITYTFQTSSDNSTWEDLNIEAHLPVRLQDLGNPVKTSVSPFYQTIGCFDFKRYVRLKFDGSADTTDVDLILHPIMQSQVSEFTGWDTLNVPSDGLP